MSKRQEICWPLAPVARSRTREKLVARGSRLFLHRFQCVPGACSVRLGRYAHDSKFMRFGDRNSQSDWRGRIFMNAGGVKIEIHLRSLFLSFSGRNDLFARMYDENGREREGKRESLFFLVYLYIEGNYLHLSLGVFAAKTQQTSLAA